MVYIVMIIRVSAPTRAPGCSDLAEDCDDTCSVASANSTVVTLCLIIQMPLVDHTRRGHRPVHHYCLHCAALRIAWCITSLDMYNDEQHFVRCCRCVHIDTV